MPSYTRRLLKARIRLQIDKANENLKNWLETIAELGIHVLGKGQQFDYSLPDSYVFDGALR